MPSKKAIVAIAVIAIVVVAAFAVYETYYAVASPQCLPLKGGSFAKNQAQKTTFGVVTEYKLPGEGRWPTAITAAPDGSVWFVEEELPGVAHLFPSNGTLLEYAWPGYTTPTPPDCVPSTAASGIALWNGRVWGASEYSNSIVGVSPSDGSVVAYNTTGKADYPYWLAAGPEGDLWFTSDNTPARLGTIFPNNTMSIINLSGLGPENPLQLDFVNSSLAFIVGINLSGNKTVNCFCDGHVYSFDPSRVSSTITPTLVGGGFRIIEPTSVSYSQGRVWVTQHGASAVVSYDFATGTWTKYPTSRVPWTYTTLPYFIDANGSRVWFNEHYANKIALIEPGSGTLTEVSESSPPASNYEGIQDDEFIALSGGDMWFTSMSGNYVGFIEGNFDPGFYVTPSGTNEATISPGANATFTLKVTGAWSAQMKVNVSGTENYSSTPNKIRVTPSVFEIPTGSSPFSLGVEVEVGQTLPPGNYTVAVTVTNGGIQQSAYLYLVVT